MNDGSIDAAVAVLTRARGEHERIAALPEHCRPATTCEAYPIQDRLVAGLGERAGWKVGATVTKAQEMLGLSGPFSARLLANGFSRSPAVIRGDELFMRVLETEVAFVLDRDLGPADDPSDDAALLHTIRSMHPAIEICDCRFDGWTSVGGPSLIADNGVDGRFVLGPEAEGWRSADLAALKAKLFVDGELVAEGLGANVLGNPLASYRWLVSHLLARGQTLCEGDVVTTGSMTPMVEVSARAEVRAEIDGAGVVELSLRDAPTAD